MKSDAQILLGSNIGDRESYLAKAIEVIGKTIGEVTQRSRIYMTPAWGIENADDFMNQAITVSTDLAPEALLDQLMKIEELLGRKRSGVMSSRTIDLDIAFYGDEIIASSRLQIPHPRLHLRNFALGPLSDIVPKKIHPISGKTVEELYSGLSDQSEVTILPA